MIEKGSLVEDSAPAFLRGIVTLRDGSKYEVEFDRTDSLDADGCAIYSYIAPASWNTLMPPTNIYVPVFPARTCVEIEVERD